MQTVISQTIQNIQPILTALVLVAFLVLLVALTPSAIRNAKSVTMQNLLTYARSVALQCVRAAMHEVQDLKNPTRPGAWTADAANAIGTKVTEKIVTILGAQLGIILKLMHSSATPAQLARELMEGELTRLKLEQAQAQAASPVSINTNVEGPSS